MNQNSDKPMKKFIEIPDCIYPKEAILITPSSQTPNHIIYLSNLDYIPFLRIPVKFLYIFKKSTCVETLKVSLSKVLVDYYPLAGRVRSNKDGKIEIDCNGKGALFAEGFLNLSVDELIEGSRYPDESWRKLLYRVDWDFFDFPPLVIQVIHLNCGGMILLTTINHSLCDAAGLSQFFNAWADITRKPNSALSVTPFHSRQLIKPRMPPNPTFTHPEYDFPSSFNLTQSILSQPLVPVSVTFTPSQINHLKKQCLTSFKCTSFEVLASHLWRAWAKVMDLPASLNVKLIFAVNARKKLSPNIPDGYYGNAFVLTCAQSKVDKLITSDLLHGVEVVRAAKEVVNDEYVRSVVDLAEVRKSEADLSAGIFELRKFEPDLSATLLISHLNRIGFEDVEFGNGTPVHAGHLESSICCMLLPVIGDVRAVRMVISVPQRVVEKFGFLLRDVGGEEWTEGDQLI